LKRGFAGAGIGQICADAGVAMKKIDIATTGQAVGDEWFFRNPKTPQA